MRGKSPIFAPNISMSESKDEKKTFSKIMNDFRQRFSGRLSPTDLMNKGILKESENNSPAILQRRLSLEDAMKKDSLNRHLSLRPTADDLKLRNILKEEEDAENSSESGESPTFQERQNQLKSCLKRRPTKAELTENNILKPNRVHPSLAETQERLRRSILENNLDDKLRERPSIAELQASRILVFSETVEVLPTFRKSEYNRKPDNSATFKNLTPALKGQIRDELNNFKRTEMPVHEDSSLF